MLAVTEGRIDDARRLMGAVEDESPKLTDADTRLIAESLIEVFGGSHTV